MATITFTFTVNNTIVDLIAAGLGWQATFADGSTNPETSKAFVKRVEADRLFSIAQAQQKMNASNTAIAALPIVDPTTVVTAT